MTGHTAGDDNDIHPSAIVGDDVKLGRRNRILPFTVLTGPLRIGDDNIIGPHVVIGSPGEDTRNPRHDSSQATIEIGSRNIIREFTAIQKPCYQDLTCLQNDIFLMHGVHVPHDAILEDGVSVAPLVVIGGIARIMKSATLGMGATVHQYSVVGPYSMVATGAAATKNVKPFSRYIPGKPVTVNHYAIEKYRFTDVSDQIESYVMGDDAPTEARLAQIVQRYQDHHLKSGRAQY